MKKLITILLAMSLPLAAVANAAQEDPKAKKNAKTGPVQKQQVAPKQNFAPKTSHVQSIHPKHTSNVNSTKVHQTNVNKPPVRAYTVLPAKIQPPQTQNLSRNQRSVKSARQPTTNVQSEELPAVQNNPPGNSNAAVMPKTKAIPNVQNIQAKYKNFKAQPKPAVVPSATKTSTFAMACCRTLKGKRSAR